METKRYAYLGHELHIGDNVQFKSLGHTITGHIVDFIGDKVVCKPLGWNGEPEFRSKIKEQYKVKCTSCWLVYIKMENEK